METGNVFDVLKERGFIRQTTHEEEIRELLGKEKITFYIGFDPTADSLHVGHFMQIMTMMHMQRHGHIPIALVGGGTTMVGDPSGRSDMRSIMSKETIMENGQRFKKTFGKFIDFSDGKAILDNNADWLLDLNYIDFLRQIGRHFSVNRMLTAECYKQRLEAGLTFLEFNYMLMQSYDFLELHRRYDCKMQFGGDDQWSNILGGIDLIRRETGDQVYGMTFTLLATKEGVKMGKTQKGALWLDPEKTPPYEFFQYWRNVDDADVENCLRLLTFLPLENIADIMAGDINKAKEILAFEVTGLVHSTEDAQKALDAARALFSGGTDLDNVPKTVVNASEFEGEGKSLVTIMLETKLAPSRSEGIRTIEQGGLALDDVKVTDSRLMITKDMFKNERILIRKGKKTYHLIELSK